MPRENQQRTCGLNLLQRGGFEWSAAALLGGVGWVGGLLRRHGVIFLLLPNKRTNYAKTEPKRRNSIPILSIGIQYT